MTKEIFQDDWWQLATEEYDECKVNLKALNSRDLDDPTKDVSVSFEVVVVVVAEVVPVVEVTNVVLQR